MYVLRTHKQHSSLVIIIPVLLRKYLKLQAGDYVVIRDNDDGKSVNMQKFIPEEPKNVGEKSKARGKAGARDN